MDLLGKLAHLPQFLLALLSPPAVAEQVRGGLVQVGFTGQFVHSRGVEHPDICFLQDFIGRGGIAGNAAEIAMQRAGRARVESLELGL